ncbi:hypothetical protein KJ885_05590 [Patescibacteria group bacterium]|nr:hypothetical protein [Patescibacteria group bacterium]
MSNRKTKKDEQRLMDELKEGTVYQIAPRVFAVDPGTPTEKDLLLRQEIALMFEDIKLELEQMRRVLEGKKRSRKKKER